ncbi:MAG: ABC transporter ATP-binding protein [Bryobacteraceae bacterium]|nr:ABC transporter ATP-binding protein [Bryobacteraceae bacterium]
MPFVRFYHVSKVYSRQSRQFFWRFFVETMGRKPREPIRALNDVTFELGAGESLAVIGHNGAGKSTLLSLVAGLTTPESGLVEVEGRVMALLELGSGFHYDMTGAENLRLNAALCGLTKKQTEERYQQIVDFSELRSFINEPLRTYSMGMILRLGFSIAVHVEADILLLDEVLVVGDQDFQQKCLTRILRMKQEGKILMCVSHAPDMLRMLCERALWIESGAVIMQGAAGDVIDAYRAGSVPVNAS